MEETLMFDFSGVYDRIAKELPDNCKVCEVGVADGISALYLATRLHELGKKFKLYMVDNLDYGKYIQLCSIYQNIIKSGLGEFIEVVPYDTLEAATMFNHGYLDFVFIDSSHLYNETKAEIAIWYNKVKDKGILSGHDYNSDEVKRAVDEMIPTIITRNDIEDRIFEPEQFLHTEQTTNGYGVWWAQKDFYKKLNT